MFSTILKKAAIAPSLALFLGSFAAVPGVYAADAHASSTSIAGELTSSAGQTEASELLKQIRGTAYALYRDSNHLESMAKSNVSRQSYVGSLNRIRAHINQTGEQLARFEQIKGVAPWQQNAIDRITPIARQLAANTQIAIQHLNDKPGQLQFPNYKSALFAIADDAREMKDSIDDHLDLAQMRQQVDNLQIKIRGSDS